MSRNISNTSGQLVNPTIYDPTLISNNKTVSFPNNGVNSSFVVGNLGSVCLYQQLTNNSTDINITTTFGYVTCFGTQNNFTTSTFFLRSSLITTSSIVTIIPTHNISNSSVSNIVSLNIYAGASGNGLVQISVVNQDTSFASAGKPNFYYFIM
jgi:hypothetical protein